MGWMHHGWWTEQWGAWGWVGLVFMIIFMIAFWILVIAGIVMLVRWILRQGRDSGTDRGFDAGRGSGSALDILKRRYAQGEISAEEYRRMKQEITEEESS